MSTFSGKFHAIFSAYVSIFAGIIEAFFSVILGHAELSMSLYGIALMAIVDVTSSVLVLFIWQDSNERDKEKKILEAKYSYIIGVLMMILGLFLVADSVKTLIRGQHLEAIGGAGISWFGTLCSFCLAAYKYRIGEELESPVIIADAVSSVCSGLTSLVALVVAYNEKFVWWLDGVAGMMVGFYTLYSGAATMTSSSHDISELSRSEAKGIKMMDKSKLYSYQEGGPTAKAGISGTRASNGEQIGLLDIMNTRPTPYNFDNETRSQLSIFRLLYNQLHENMLTVNRSHNTMAYERIPASESEDEITFYA